MSGFARVAPGASLESPPVIFAGPGNYTLEDFTRRVIVKKTSSSSTTIYMNPNPPAACEFVVTDGKGDALSYQITIDGNGHLIDGLATKTISTNRGSVTMFYDGAEFYVTGERI